MINEDVIAFAKIHAGSNKTQCERRRPDERDLFALAIQQLRGEFARVVLGDSDQGLAAGQFAVLYQGGVCLGSAKILGRCG